MGLELEGKLQLELELGLEFEGYRCLCVYVLS